jgi:hypothetical protein
MATSLTNEIKVSNRAFCPLCKGDPPQKILKVLLKVAVWVETGIHDRQTHSMKKVYAA